MKKDGGMKKDKLEYLRTQSKQKFDLVRATWLEAGEWALPYSTRYLKSQRDGERNNRHITDPTHTLSLRSCVAGFNEGNSSATRPWFIIRTSGDSSGLSTNAKAWLQFFTDRCRRNLMISNFYHATPGFYYHYNVYNTGTYWIDELPTKLHFHLLIPGSYFILNNSYGEATTLVMERELTVRQIVDEYGEKDAKGNWDWSNFSDDLRGLYESGDVTQKIVVVTTACENKHYDSTKPTAMLNKLWIIHTYETGSSGASGYDRDALGIDATFDMMNPANEGKYLRIEGRSRKPFVVGASPRNGNFEYGEMGPTTDSLGLIKSLNYKAIAKDQAIEQMLRPALQGPANLNRSYITSASNSFVPLDPTSAKPGGGLRSIFEINPAFGSLLQDQADLRRMVDKFYYADFLLFLSNNPKTRTAAEANAIVQEQQTVIGPQLQSLNVTHNLPIVDYVMDYTLETDPELPPIPEELQGQFMRTEFISVFAQALKAADLPNIERYVAAMMAIAPLDPKVLQKVNTDKLADLYEDRLYLPVGLNNPQDIVDARREQQQAMAARQQMIQEQLPAVAGAAKDLGVTAGRQQE